MKLALNLFLLVISIKSFGNIESNSIVAIVNENIITSQSIKTQLDQASSPSKKISLINVLCLNQFTSLDSIVLKVY